MKCYTTHGESAGYIASEDKGLTLEGGITNRFPIIRPGKTMKPRLKMINGYWCVFHDSYNNGALIAHLAKTPKEAYRAHVVHETIKKLGDL